MAKLTDITSIPDTISSLYEKVRADLISHIFLAVVLVSLGFDFTGLNWFTFDAGKIIQDPRFKFIKDSGLIFLIPVIPVLMLLMYGGLLRTVGGFLVDVTGIFWAPPK